MARPLVGARTGPSPKRVKVLPPSRLTARPIAPSTGTETRRLQPADVAANGVAVAHDVQRKDPVFVIAAQVSERNDRARSAVHDHPELGVKSKSAKAMWLSALPVNRRLENWS